MAEKGFRSCKAILDFEKYAHKSPYKSYEILMFISKKMLNIAVKPQS